ncbi:hypothetical protein CQW23_29761 [Capsicum baccatum]|uniref:NYN domain-containing protein n=1 Tax=Capsicum baccatum TaxID=33114 RepID=A0A2G2VCD3_CAPBA|nr:hypothetical protein CQW23_29761 [Capsicum baccatum]
MGYDECAAVRISVWWDIENYQVPSESDPHAIAQNISSMLMNMNYCVPISISAYGDMTKISASVQQALNSTEIGLDHFLAVGTMEHPKSIPLVEVNDLNSPAFWDKNKATNPKRTELSSILKTKTEIMGGESPSLGSLGAESYSQLKDTELSILNWTELILILLNFPEFCN